jgi:TetR/AcrR family transcriptional regulator, cholesterol catabolism regulator
MKVAAELFENRAYQETSMEAIARQVGIRKASLYYYFSSKDDLLAQMHLGIIEPIIDAHQRRLDASALDPRALLLAMMTDLVSLLETHPGHMRGVFEHFRELPETVRAKIAEQRDRYRRMLVDVLDQGVAEGAFAIADPDLTALAILGMCSGTYQWFRPGGELTAAQVAQYFYDTLMTGIDTAR